MRPAKKGGLLGDSLGLDKWVNIWPSLHPHLLSSLAIPFASHHAFADAVFASSGYPMAKNLRARIPEDDTLVIHDRNTEATTKFVEELGAKGDNIQVVGSPRAVAEKSVCEEVCHMPKHLFIMMSMFYQ